MEDEGIGDQLTEVQQKNFPWDEIRNGTFKRIDFCFHCQDETLLWCRGDVKLVKDQSEWYKYMVVEVKWDPEYVKPGDANPIRQKLEKRH